MTRGWEISDAERLTGLLAEVEAVSTALGGDTGVSIRELPGAGLARERCQALGAAVDPDERP